MRLVKLGHACVRLEENGSALVIDPGAVTEASALDGANAVLITHEHYHHLEPERLRAAMAANPALDLWTNASVAARLADLGGRVHPAAHGDTFSAAGFGVHVYGSDHAVLHRDLPLTANIGFMIDGEVFHGRRWTFRRAGA